MAKVLIGRDRSLLTEYWVRRTSNKLLGGESSMDVRRNHAG